MDCYHQVHRKITGNLIVLHNYGLVFYLNLKRKYSISVILIWYFTQILQEHVIKYTLVIYFSRI